MIRDMTCGVWVSGFTESSDWGYILTNHKKKKKKKKEKNRGEEKIKMGRDWM